MYRVIRLARSPMSHALFALALLVRGMTVPGYMAGGDGWPVQLCPEGLLPVSVALLFGDGDSTNSHHHGHADTGDGSGPAESGISKIERCTLGGSTGPALLSGSTIALPIPSVFLLEALDALPVWTPAPASSFQARAPPRTLPYN